MTDKIKVSWVRNNGATETHIMDKSEARELWDRFKNTDMGLTFTFSDQERKQHDRT